VANGDFIWDVGGKIVDNFLTNPCISRDGKTLAIFTVVNGHFLEGSNPCYDGLYLNFGHFPRGEERFLTNLVAYCYT
jgi:hypothetical protein